MDFNLFLSLYTTNDKIFLAVRKFLKSSFWLRRSEQSSRAGNKPSFLETKRYSSCAWRENIGIIEGDVRFCVIVDGKRNHGID